MQVLAMSQKAVMWLWVARICSNGRCADLSLLQGPEMQRAAAHSGKRCISNPEQVFRHGMVSFLPSRTRLIGSPRQHAAIALAESR